MTMMRVLMTSLAKVVVNNNGSGGDDNGEIYFDGTNVESHSPWN